MGVSNHGIRKWVPTKAIVSVDAAAKDHRLATKRLTLAVYLLADTSYPCILDGSVTTVNCTKRALVYDHGASTAFAPDSSEAQENEPLKSELFSSTAPPPSIASPSTPPIAPLGLPPPPPNFFPCCCAFCSVCWSRRHVS